MANTVFKKLTDNAECVLATGVDDNDLSLVLQAGDGAKLPASGAFVVTLFEEDPAAGEKVLIDSRSTDTLTVNASGRGYDGSSAAAWDTGSNVQLLLCSLHLEEVQAAVNAIEDGSKELAEVNVAGDVVAGGDLIGSNVSVGADDAAVARHIVNCGPAGVGAVEFQDAGVNRLRIRRDAATGVLALEVYDSSGVLDATLPLFDESGAMKTWQQRLTANGVDLSPRTGSAPCGAAVLTEFRSARNYQWALPFDQNTDENAVAVFPVPPGYAGGTFEVELFWSATSGTVAQVVRWSCWMAAFADGDTLDEATAGGIRSAEDALQALKDLHVARCTTITPYASGTLANAKWLVLNVFRDADHANDTLTADALLLGAVVTLT